MMRETDKITWKETGKIYNICLPELVKLHYNSLMKYVCLINRHQKDGVLTAATAEVPVRANPRGNDSVLLGRWQEIKRE